MQRFRVVPALVVFILLAASAAQAAARPTVVVAPLFSASAEEYQWIGGAIAESLSERLLGSGQANVLSQRQWAAVLRERNIAARGVRSDEDAVSVARQLGADQVIVGSFVAAWPNVTISMRRLAVGATRPMAAVEVSGHIEELPKLEGQIARGIFKANLAKAARTGGAPKNVYAWRDLASCRATLALQSMGPRAELWLPKLLIERAEKDCAAAEKADKKLVEATAFRGLAQFLLGQKKEGSKLAETALKKRRVPGWADQIAFFTRFRNGDTKGAEKVLVAAIKKAPGFLHARTTLGETLAERGALDEAKVVFEGSLKEAPKQPWIHVQLSKVLARQKDVDGAVKVIEKALAVSPGDAVLLMEKASRQIDDKRWPAAEKTLREAMAADPRQAATYLRLGYVYLETNQLPLAGPILQKALYEADLESEARVRGYAHFDLAKLAVRNSKPDDALAHVQSAVQAGLSAKERYEADPDLGGLLKDPRFAAIFK